MSPSIDSILSEVPKLPDGSLRRANQTTVVKDIDLDIELDRNACAKIREINKLSSAPNQSGHPNYTSSLGTHQDIQTGHTEVHTQNVTIDLSLDPIIEGVVKTNNQKKIWRYLLQIRHLKSSTKDLADFLSIPVSTVRKVLYRFEEHDLIELVPYNEGYNRGLEIKVRSQHPKVGAQNMMLPGMNLDIQNSFSRKIDLNKTSIYEKIAEISDDFIAESYPHLFDIGFGQSQLLQLIEIWSIIDLIPRGIHESLRRADWFVETQQDSPKGDKIKNYLYYIFSSLRQKGAFLPRGYVDQTLLAEEEELKREKRLLEIREERSSIRMIKQKKEEDSRKFEAWVKCLSENAKIDILSDMKKRPFTGPDKSDEGLLRLYFNLSVSS